MLYSGRHVFPSSSYEPEGLPLLSRMYVSIFISDKHLIHVSHVRRTKRCKMSLPHTSDHSFHSRPCLHAPLA